MAEISPNQQALPGMEAHAHPGVRMLSDYQFSFHHDEDLDEYRLDAHERLGNGITSLLPKAYLRWQGRDPQTTSDIVNYPGEIGFVAVVDSHRGRGLAAAMYHMGNQLDMGQETVPVHSPNRTSYGKHWAKKVGGPMPDREDYEWRPPKGLHPYERRQSDVLNHDQIPGQGRLF